MISLYTTLDYSSAMKISNLIAQLEAIRAGQGDLTCAEEAPLGF